MSELTAPLRDLLDGPYDDARLLAVQRRLRASQRRRRRRGARPALLAAAVLVGALFGAVLALALAKLGPGREGVGVARLEGGAPLGALAVARGEPGPTAFRLDDGSRLRLEAGASLETLENRHRRVVLELRSGRATFDITPGRFELFRVLAAGVEVDVVGTVFTVERRRSEVVVEVVEGVVQVRGEPVPGRHRRLLAGERLALALALALEPSSPTVAGQAAVAGDGGPSGSPHRAAPSAGRPPPPESSWRSLARARSYDAAYLLLGPAGVTREVERAEDPEALFALADVARLSGHPREAIAPLERLIERHRSDRRAALAAFTLGRIHLDVLREPEAAVRDFERTLRLAPPPTLREDASLRLVEARLALGDQAGARAAALGELERDSRGRHAPRLRALTGIEAP